MTKDLNNDRDTLRYALTRMRVNKPTPFGQTRTSASMAEVINDFMGADKFSMDPVFDPIVDAAEFYMLNHVVGEIRARYRLDEHCPMIGIVREYDRLASHHAMRLTTYLTLITTRESRHSGSKMSMVLSGVHDPSALTFIDTLKSKGSTSAAMTFRKSPPTCSFLAYVAAVRDTFYKGSFGSSFGGPKWGKIADCLLKFVNGTYSAEMMIDHAWALQHNGGAMFNKGMVYSHPSSNSLYQILDVQRAGMMPNFFWNDADCPKTPLMFDLMKAAHKHFGDDWGTAPIDWDHVVSLGAMSSLSKGKAGSVPKSTTPKTKAVPKAASPKPSVFKFGKLHGGATKIKREVA